MHWNVWLGGGLVDPFAREDRPEEAPILRAGRLATTPEAAEPPPHDAVACPWDQAAAARVLASCRDEATRSRLSRIADPYLRAGSVFVEASYFPTRFASREPLLHGGPRRAPRLDLPFSREDFDGLVLADEV